MEGAGWKELLTKRDGVGGGDGRNLFPPIPISQQFFNDVNVQLGVLNNFSAHTQTNNIQRLNDREGTQHVLVK